MRYSRDASIYFLEPIAFASPSDEEQLIALIRFANEERVVLCARGGGTGTGGAALSCGIIIDFAQFNNFSNILSSTDGEFITVGAGVNYRKLHDHLIKKDLFVPIYPSSAAQCRIGGNIATRASGPDRFHYGAIDNYVQRIVAIDITGQSIVADSKHESLEISNSLKKELRDYIADLRNDQEIVNSIAQRKCRNSGYDLASLIRAPLPQAIPQLLCNSLGTLAFISEVTLRCLPQVAARATIVALFIDENDAFCVVNMLRVWKSNANVHSVGQVEHGIADSIPEDFGKENAFISSIECFDGTCLNLLRQNKTIGEIARNIAPLASYRYPHSNSHLPMPMVLLISVHANGEEEARNVSESIGSIINSVRVKSGNNPMYEIYYSVEEQRKIWAMRSNITATINQCGDMRSYALVNDIAVSPDKVATLLVTLRKLMDSYHIICPIYGHAGTGNLHLRPLFSKAHDNLIELFRNFTRDVYSLVIDHEGSVSFEHGLGRQRSPFFEQEVGCDIYRAMKRLKYIFDPMGLLNSDAMFARDMSSFIRIY